MPDYCEFSVYVKKPGVDKVMYADYISADGQVLFCLNVVIYHKFGLYEGLRNPPQNQQVLETTQSIPRSRYGQYG
jgi:hypothetical protein